MLFVCFYHHIIVWKKEIFEQEIPIAPLNIVFLKINVEKQLNEPEVLISSLSYWSSYSWSQSRRGIKSTLSCNPFIAPILWVKKLSLLSTSKNPPCFRNYLLCTKLNFDFYLFLEQLLNDNCPVDPMLALQYHAGITGQKVHTNSNDGKNMLTGYYCVSVKTLHLLQTLM